MPGYIFQIHFLVRAQLCKMANIIPIFQIKKMRLRETRQVPQSTQGSWDLTRKSSRLLGLIRGLNLSFCLSFLSSSEINVCHIPRRPVYKQPLRSQLKEACAQDTAELLAGRFWERV